ncbi:hypothetical protein [Actinomadura sp. 3N508]|uniref:hypothetical protein n=1 Tax=Actinomadura sp. 3N508 TaxID=3375153 RepID=UPI00379B51CE
MTTHSDARQGAEEEQEQEAMPFVPVQKDPNAQARRACVRAREDATTDPDTERDGESGTAAPRWAASTARTLANQPPLTTAPPTVKAMSDRVSERVDERAAPLPRLAAWLGWYLACAVCCVALAPAYLAHLPYGGRPLVSLADLARRVHQAAARQPTGAAAAAYYTVGAACVTVCAAAYAVVYAVQYPALLVLVGFCGGIAWLTTL